MDILVNAIGAGPLARVNASGPARNNIQPDTASSGQAAEASPPLPPEVKPRLDAPTVVAAPGRQERAANENIKAITASLPRAAPAALPATKRAVFEHDEVSGLSIVKFMDSKGNVIIQVPPEHFLKTVQLLKEFGGVGFQAFSGETENTKLTGLLLNKKV